MTRTRTSVWMGFSWAGLVASTCALFIFFGFGELSLLGGGWAAGLLGYPGVMISVRLGLVRLLIHCPSLFIYRCCVLLFFSFLICHWLPLCLLLLFPLFWGSYYISLWVVLFTFSPPHSLLGFFIFNFSYNLSLLCLALGFLVFACACVCANKLLLGMVFFRSGGGWNQIKLD